MEMIYSDAASPMRAALQVPKASCGTASCLSRLMLSSPDGHATVDSPAELNKMGDDILSERVNAVLGILAEPSAAEPCTEVLPALAPFITADVMLRLHNLVVESRRLTQSHSTWTKQRLLAVVVGSFTGVKISRMDAEYIGNAEDSFLRNYNSALKKAKQALCAANYKAKKSGRDTPAHYNERVDKLREQVYRCSFGGVPRNVVVCDSRSRGNAPIHKQPVPFKKVEFADRTNMQLKEKLSRLEEQQQTHRRESEHTISMSIVAVEREKRARREAEISAEKVAAEAAEALRAAEQKAEEAAQQLRQTRRAAERSAVEREARLARLGGQVATAHVEAARMAEREMKTRKELEQLISSEVAARLEAEQKAKEVAQQLRQTRRAAERSAVEGEARLARLGGQVATAHVEAARMAEREERVRKEAEQLISSEAAAKLAAEQKVVEAAHELRQAKRSHELAAAQGEAKIARLGGQVAAAHFEAAQMAEREEKVRRQVEALELLLQTQVEANQHMRDLKAQMAKRKRWAEAKAETAVALQKDLEASRKRCRELRNQVHEARVEMSLQSDMSSSSSDELESDSEEEGHVRSRRKLKAKAEAELERARSQEALERINSMPTWRAVHGAGRGAAKLEWGTRVPTAPTCETVQRCRFELRFVEEALGARRVASAFRLRGIGFDETTKFGLASLTSNVTIEPTEGACLEDVILRAAYCPMGGTSQKIVESIQHQCFVRLRDFLHRWREHFEKLFPGEQWTGPDPSLCSLHRLGGGGAMMSDTCTAARCTKRLLGEEIAQQVEANLGAQKWSEMSGDERAAAVRVHAQDCWQHLVRNIFLAEMSRAMASHVKEELQPELDLFSAWERMSTEFSQLLRAAYKEFHHGCRYYKGKGREFWVWLRDNYPKGFVVHLERADGGRQDLDFDAAIPLFVNRKYFVEFLHGFVFNKGHKNILEDFLYVTFRSTQFIAMVRANAIIDILVSRPLRWLSGKARQLDDWSPVSMGEALDLVYDFFEKAELDGSLFLDPSLDIFQPIAEKQPLFREWRDFTWQNDTMLSPDGTTPHLVFKLARDELVRPQDPTNANESTRLKTIEYLQIQCRAALAKMRDPRLALRDKLSKLDGANSVANAAVQHNDTVGCHATNDVLAESIFGTYDMILKRCPGISMEAASGVAQSVRSGALSLGDNVARRKNVNVRKDADYVGYFHSLPAHEQEALVDLARVTVKEMRQIDHADHAALDEYKKARRKANEEEELDELFTQYALALSFFERWQQRGVSSMAEANRALNSYGTTGERDQEKLDWLREQIEMRTVGLGWTEFKAKWSSLADEHVGTIDQLKTHLKEILQLEEKTADSGELPSKTGEAEKECPAPMLQRKTFKALGTPTVQAGLLCNARTELTPEMILEAAKRRRLELETAGEIDWVGDRQPYPTGQGPVCDNGLLGKRLEVRWRYRNKETGEPVYIWCEGTASSAGCRR